MFVNVPIPMVRLKPTMPPRQAQPFIPTVRPMALVGSVRDSGKPAEMGEITGRENCLLHFMTCKICIFGGRCLLTFSRLFFRFKLMTRIRVSNTLQSYQAL
jgi:hypothetical protein